MPRCWSIAGPKTDFFAPEIDMLKRYLAKGGKVLLLLDPPDKAGGGDLTSLTALLKDWAIEVGNNVVVDVSGMGQLLGTGTGSRRWPRSTSPTRSPIDSTC